MRRRSCTYGGVATVLPETLADTAPIGPGALVLLVGPSGAGKDTILRRSRDALADEPRIRFPRRVVTRVADGTEDHDTMTEAEFVASRARGHFLLVWQAHGLFYGVPTDVARFLRAGETVVINASRTVITAARHQFAQAYVVLVTAPRDIRAKRLLARGRDRDLDQRLARDLGADDELRSDLTVDNSGSVDEAAQVLCRFLCEVRDAGVAAPVRGQDGPENVNASPAVQAMPLRVLSPQLDFVGPLRLSFQRRTN